nr:immunoglobulin light chain junction region [Macaca mulatta]MOV61479.1 immunoglobulin light chain junction region [Macaca mulatta]MOV62831.1 immunoglobulin light chain junction region [Macaca mulatta]MOV63104.1 immunoglobulin light chain junction region [Macaca mulatta]MOV64221.1 immunoglobulin light chain junction region [Macaca mulatta]
CQQYNTLPWTF